MSINFIPICKRNNFFIDFFYNRDKMCIGIFIGIVVKKTVYICSDNDNVGTGLAAELAKHFEPGQYVIVSDYGTDPKTGKVHEIGDPTETAIVYAAHKSGMEKEALNAESPRLAELPFDSDRKLMSTINRMDGRNIVIVKGAFDMMAERCIAGDLEKARKELNGIIEQLESEMKTSFVDSFNKINENFGKVFSELFGGGSAELSLTEPEDVLSSGIEIKAAPPGKIIKNMVQLSGGEQSFIAIALFFAILQVNPTPFCILDEIEAALDEVNVARFAEYIKRYSSETQFVMITHRRGTMEAANRLYGVTMPERGISKVLELNIDDISKKKGEDWDGIFG